MCKHLKHRRLRSGHHRLRRIRHPAAIRLRASIPLNRLLPMLRQANTHKRECLDFSINRLRWVAIPYSRRVGYTTVSLSIVCIVLCSIRNHHSSRPSIVPYTDNLEHVTALKHELVAGAWLVCPKRGYLVARVDLVLGIVVFEVWELF